LGGRGEGGLSEFLLLSLKNFQMSMEVAHYEDREAIFLAQKFNDNNKLSSKWKKMTLKNTCKRKLRVFYF